MKLTILPIKYLIVYFFIKCFFATELTFAQPAEKQAVVTEQKNVGTGALVDKKRYGKVPMTPFLTRSSQADLPLHHSLKQYCPTPGNQENTATCVGWAVSYGIKTMIEAMLNGWENTTKEEQAFIDQNAYSPSYVYNQITPEDSSITSRCNVGAYVTDALQFLKTHGTVRISDFPFDGQSCESWPGQDLQKQAEANTIKDYLRLTFTMGDNAKVRRTRESIANGMPVVITMNVNRHFKYGQHENAIWQHDKGDQASEGPHAMVVISYDDDKQLLEVMNSWGTTWGNGGFLYVTYSDFEQYVDEIYQVLYDYPNGNEEDNDLLDNQTEGSNFMSASVHFNQLKTIGAGEEIACVPESAGTMKAQRAKGGYVYKMSESYQDWTGYQIYLSPKSTNMNVYILSTDKSNDIELLYPFSSEILGLYGEAHETDQLSPIIPYKTGSLAVPHEDYCMQLNTNKGTINCFLFTKRNLDMAALLPQIRASRGTLLDRLSFIFKSKLVSPQNIQYQKNEIGFSVHSDEDIVVPIFVDMNHLEQKTK